MSIVNTLNFILNHPLNSRRKLAALMCFVHWQVSSRITRAPIVKSFVESTRLLVTNGMTGATQNIYCGLHEFEDMAFILHALRDTDNFVDIGANIGAYTVLAAGVAGARCISIEPIPATFVHLLDNINLNGISGQVVALNIGLGDTCGVQRFTASLDTVNHILATNEAHAETIEIKIERLDDLLTDFEPTFIKVDVEGYETNVVAGAHQVLSRTSLLAVIMELNGSGERYGFDENHLHKKMLGYGFKPFRYAPFKRKLVQLDGKNSYSGNTLYIRNEKEIRRRLEYARSFETNLGIKI